MSSLPYYKAYPRDFIEGTIGMPFEIKCAYRVILDLIYMQSGDLPDDARYISGLLGCSIRKWKSIREFLINADKLQINGDFLTNYRAVSELESLAKLQDKQRKNRSGPNKNKGLQKPRFDHPEPEPESYIDNDNKLSSSIGDEEIISPQKVAELWNEICHILNPVGGLSLDRENKILCLIRGPLDNSEKWKGFFQNISNSSFLRGEVVGSFQATFDWAINPRNAVKVIDGNYSDRKAGTAFDPVAAMDKKIKERQQQETANAH